MARHPRVFMTKQEFEQALVDVDCHPNYADDASSDFSILMPLLIHTLGREEFFRIVEEARPEIFLEEADTAWDRSIYYFVRWADNEIEQFRQRKLEEQQRREQRNQ